MNVQPNRPRTIERIAVRLQLSELGDALFWGEGEGVRENPGRFLKHRLFAWHEPSFYGTDLEVETVGKEQVVILPAEQVIEYLASGTRLAHIDWEWEGEAANLIALTPPLLECLENGRYVPDIEAYREGELRWIWDEVALSSDARRALEAAGAGGAGRAESAGEALGGPGAGSGEADGKRDYGGEDEALGKPGAQDVGATEAEARLLTAGNARGLRAAFSAAVFSRCYGTEAAAADLRRDFPLLFASDGASAAGLDAGAWLVRIGWKADTAPFRPVLQLLEPPKEGFAWRLRLVLQDKQDVARLVPVRLTGSGEAFAKWPDGWEAHARERSAGWLEQLRANLPPGLVSPGDDALGRNMDDAAAWRFLTADGPRLLTAGWQVLLPGWWEAAKRKKPRLRAKIAQEQPQGGGRSLFGLDAILSFDWRIAIGDVELSEPEFRRLVARGERLVRFHDRWIALDPELLAQIQRAMEGMDRSQGLSFQDALQLHLLGQADDSAAGGDAPDSAEDAERRAAEETMRLRIEVELNEHLARLVAQLHRQAELPKPETPAGLRAELRSYQRDGFAWLALLRQFGLGACLADDMGLGKTVQLISYLLHGKEQAPEGEPQPALIVCPTSVLGNWQKELQRFAPSLRVMLHYGSGRLSDSEAFAEAARSADVVLTSYATASLDQETLQSFEWAAICLDEAQNIKNAQTKQSTAVRSFRARHRVALTGTPVENRLAELWSIYDFIVPGYLGGQNAFQKRFASAIEQEGDPKRTAELRRLIQPFMLRRKKKDPAIQLDLPDKNEMKTYVHLTAEQAAAYDRSVRELLDKLQKLEGIERKGAVLGALTKLKQICDHPRLLDGGDAKADGAAATAAADDAPDGAARAGLAVGADVGTKKTELAAMSAVRPDEAELAAIVQQSSKLERLLDMVKELRDEGDRCLIFTQFIGMGRMIQSMLQQELGEPVLYLNGSTPKKQRDAMIERFQSRELPPDEQPNVFVLSLKAGGVGLNLTAANHVFHFDRWWNPAVENQATDRAYRIGQTKDVQVHKFIALGTLEERIDEMLENKQALSDNVVSSSEGWITELSNDELRDLFTRRRNWSG